MPPDASPDQILIERRGPAMWIRLERPEKRNAITRAMAAVMRGALEQAREDPGIRVVVLTGSGKAFSSGADTTELFGGAAGKSMLTERRSAAAPVFPVDEMVLCPKPTIAALGGPAVGGGATMAMAADLRVCSEDASISFGLARLGLTPEWGSSYLLWRQVGWSRALDLMLTGRTVQPDEALRLGLVDRVVNPAELEPSTQHLAETLAAVPEGTAEATKAVLRAGLDLTYPEARLTELRALARRGRELAGGSGRSGGSGEERNDG